MFDKKKISLNHNRSYRCSKKRTKKFFTTICEMLIERALINYKITNKTKILELASRNNSLTETFKIKKLSSNFFQSSISKDIELKNNKRVIFDLNSQGFKSNFFDICFCNLSINSSDNIPLVFSNVYNMLKPEGIFLTTLPSNDSFIEFKSFFFNFFKTSKNYSFNPALDIQTLGNIGNSAGFKNVIVDKEEFNLKVNKPEEVWGFVRSLGESNYLKNRKEFTVKKTLYKKFYFQYKSEILNKNLINNNFSLYFFIGTK